MIGEKTIERHGMTWHKVTINQKRKLLEAARIEKRLRMLADLQLVKAEPAAIFGELQAFDEKAMSFDAWIGLTNSFDGRAEILTLAGNGAEIPPMTEAEEWKLVADLCGIDTTRKPEADAEGEPAERPTEPGETTKPELSYGT